MKRLVALAAAALAAILTLLALNASGGLRQGRTITVFARFSDTSIHFVDAPPVSTNPPFDVSPGDVIVQTSKLTDAGNRPAGTRYTLRTIFTASKHATSVALEHSVFKLAGGSIVEETVNAPGQPPVAAVTGGAGAYVGAKGTVTTINSFAKKQQEFSIRLQ